LGKNQNLPRVEETQYYHPDQYENQKWRFWSRHGFHRLWSTNEASRPIAPINKRLATIKPEGIPEGRDMPSSVNVGIANGGGGVNVGMRVAVG
jgi:hypothetical protein